MTRSQDIFVLRKKTFESLDPNMFLKNFCANKKLLFDPESDLLKNLICRTSFQVINLDQFEEFFSFGMGQ